MKLEGFEEMENSLICRRRKMWWILCSKGQKGG